MNLPLETRPRLSLRPYQQAAIDATYRYLAEHDGHPVVVLPTGAGKSLVMAELVRDAITSWPGTRILILAHVKELLEQNAGELRGHFPGVDLGIYSAGLRSRQTRNQVLVASIQSVYRRAFDLGRFDLVLVDECHLIPTSSDAMYRRFLGDARLVNPHLRVVGLTATDYRLDCGRLTEGADRFFDAVAHEVNVGDLIREGYLCRVTTKHTTTQLDLHGVHTRGGEYIPGELAAAVDVDEVTRAAVGETVAAGAERLAWLVFCASVDHALHVAEELRARGIPAGTVTGETPTPERDRLIGEFREGRLRALTNCNVLTTGFNVPHVDLIALLRPTKSPGLYVQMVGRGTRNAPGKTDCLVLDFGGVIERFGPIDALAVDVGNRGSGEPGEAPVKVCPKCETYVLIAAVVCPECGHQFPPREPKVAPVASKKAILSDDVVPEWVPVQRVSYYRHDKPGKPPSLRVVYQLGLGGRVSEWVCLEHGGFAQEKAAQWWRRRGELPVPRDVLEALQRVDAGELREPAAIQVRQEGKYDRITAYRFPVDPGPAAGDERDTGDPDERPWPGQPPGEALERLQRDEAPLGGPCGLGSAPGPDCPF